MMNQLTRVAILLLLAGAAVASPAFARHGKDKPGRRNGSDAVNARGEWRWTRGDDQRLRNVAVRLEVDTDRFRRNLDAGLDRGRLDGTRREDNLNAEAKSLENAADRLAKHDGNSSAMRQAVHDVFDAAVPLDAAMRPGGVGDTARRDWRRVNADLNVLASYFPRLAAHADSHDDNRRWNGDWRQHREWDDDRD
jgi:hypothetical protein